MVSRRPPTTASVIGHFVLVVGPSGAGKDTLISFARDALAGDSRFVFVQRVITRPPGEGESNTEMDGDAFSAAAASGAFALAWRTHGHGYGIPASIRDDLAAGRVVIANVSRMVLENAAAIADRRTVIEIAASPETLARRIAARGREAGDAVTGRLARRVPVLPAGAAHIVIQNDGELATTGAALVALLRNLD